jgi:hypothetical protein
MMLRNRVSRTRVVKEGVGGAALVNERVILREMELNGELQSTIKQIQRVICTTGADAPPSISPASPRDLTHPSCGPWRMYDAPKFTQIISPL